MKKTLIFWASVIALVITIPLSCSDTASFQQEKEPNINTFVSSNEFENLVITTKKIIDVQVSKYLKLDNEERDKYVAKLNSLTSILEENPSKNNLIKFVNHTGFNGLEHYLSLYKQQADIRKALRNKFPAYTNLEEKEKNTFLKRAFLEYQNINVKKDDIAYFGPCEDALEAKRTAAYGVATAALLACGQSAGAVAVVNIFAGAIYYGVCAGAVYATLNAKLDQYQAEYEMCIADQ